MSNKQKLELTWIGKDNRPRLEPRIRVELAENPQRPDSPLRSYDTVLDVCGGPRCPCLNIRFVCLTLPSKSPGGPALHQRQFWLHLETLSAVSSPEFKNDPESQRLAEIIRAELTESDKQRLREWYLAAKLELIQTTPVSHIDITGLPDAGDGKMIGFVDVFPCGGLALNFTHHGEAWAVDEQYCVQPECRCSETVLSFLKLMDAAGKKTEAIREAPTLRFNYRSLATESLERPAGCPSPETLLAALKDLHPNLNDQLEQRHLIMQLLYARHYQARAETRLKNPSARAAAAGPHKIGRNDLCPCGSGRKYKHCCLNKAQP